MSAEFLPPLDASFPLDPDRPFTTADAVAAGLTPRELTWMCRTGQIRRLLRGVYAATCVPDSIELRAEALSLVVPAGCFVADRTAAWLHGAEMAMAPNEHLAVPPISVFRPSDGGRLRNPITVSGERRIRSEHLQVLHGLTVTTPLRTALDLGRLQRRDLAMAGLDAMARLGAFTMDELLSGVTEFKGQRNVVQLRHLAPLTDPGSHSFGESATKLRWYAAGLPRPQTQIPIVEDGVVVYWLDLGLEELRFAAEYDGERFHGDHQQEHDETRRARIQSDHHYVLEVLRKVNVFGLRQDAEQRLSAAFGRAKRSFERRSRYF